MPAIAAVIVVVTLAAIVSGRVPAVLALLCALVVAGFVGIATPAELFAGLGNSGVITIAAMLVIAKGVFYTGVVSRVMFRLLSGVASVRGALARLIPPVGVLSAMINTTPIMAMLIPATKELEQTNGVPARAVLLPIAHATTLAGSATLIGTSSNLLIAGIAKTYGVSLSMFSFVPVAVPVALAGWAVLLLTAPLLKRGHVEAGPRELTWRAEIPLSESANSIGRPAGELGIARTTEFELVGVKRLGAKVSPRSRPVAEGGRQGTPDREDRGRADDPARRHPRQLVRHRTGGTDRGGRCDSDGADPRTDAPIRGAGAELEHPGHYRRFHRIGHDRCEKWPGRDPFGPDRCPFRRSGGPGGRRVRRHHDSADQCGDQRRRGGNPDPGRHRGRHQRGPQPGGPADPDRHLHLVHLPQPDLASDQSDGHGARGYSTTTFVRFGVPVTVVVLTASILMGWALLT